MCIILAINKDLTLTGSEAHYDDLNTSAPDYRRRIVNAVADLSEKFKGKSSSLYHLHSTTSHCVQNMGIFI